MLNDSQNISMLCGLCRSPPQQYEYKPLHTATNEIRLLYPQPDLSVSNCWDRTLRFSIKTAQLAKGDTVNSYYAISYAWGKSSCMSKITINEQTLRVPCGTEEALRGVLWGMKSAKLKMLPLWIDAICINQHDDTGEKSQQVRIMGDVYARAESVLIWLGPDKGSGKKSVQMCHRLSDECLLWTNNGHDLDANKCLPPSERQDLPYMKLPPPAARQLEAFYSLLKYRWFSRTWVIQEVVLSKQAIVICGKSHIPWDTFALAIQWARHRIPLWSAECVTTDDFESLVKINKLARLRLGLQDRTMEALLTYASRFQSTDPRDQVYGLIGMVEPCAEVEPVVPDYRKSVKEIYARATWYAIRQELSLELLCSITPRPDEKQGTENSWPSWVPRYDLEHRKSDAPTFSPDSNAHNDIEAIISLDRHLPFNLQAHGVSLGCIETLRQAQDTISNGMYEGLDTVYRQSSYLWGPDFAKSKDTTWTSSLIKTIASALVCGKYSRDSDDPHQDAESDPATVVDFVAFMLETKKRCSMPDDPYLQTLLESHQAEKGDAALYAKSVEYFAQKFVPFELPNAKYGMGYTACQKDDEVCILFGARQPFVMRKFDGHYRLLGPVYVEGVMKGEYVQGLEDEGVLETEDRVYNIR